MRLVAVLLLLGLTACGSAPTRLYTLQAIAPTAALAGPVVPYQGPAVRVNTVHVPPEFDRIELVTSSAPGELKISDLDHWSAPLARLAQQVLTADLLARLPPGKVIFPHAARADGELGIAVDILDFDTRPPRASMHVTWTLTSGGPQVERRQGTALLQTPIGGGDAPAVARSFSELMAQLTDRLAANL